MGQSHLLQHALFDDIVIKALKKQQTVLLDLPIEPLPTHSFRQYYFKLNLIQIRRCCINQSITDMASDGKAPKVNLLDEANQIIKALWDVV